MTLNYDKHTELVRGTVLDKKINIKTISIFGAGSNKALFLQSATGFSLLSNEQHSTIPFSDGREPQ